MLSDADIALLESLLGQTINRILGSQKEVTTKALIHHLQLAKEKECNLELQRALNALIGFLVNSCSENHGYPNSKFPH